MLMLTMTRVFTSYLLGRTILPADIFSTAHSFKKLSKRCQNSLAQVVAPSPQRCLWKQMLNFQSEYQYSLSPFILCLENTIQEHKLFVSSFPAEGNY